MSEDRCGGLPSGQKVSTKRMWSRRIGAEGLLRDGWVPQKGRGAGSIGAEGLLRDRRFPQKGCGAGSIGAEGLLRDRRFQQKRRERRFSMRILGYNMLRAPEITTISHTSRNYDAGQRGILE